MQFKVEVKGVEEALKLFDPIKLNRAAMSALNESAKAAKSEASRVIRNEEGWKISKSDVDKKIAIKPASLGTLQAVVSINRIKGKDSFSLSYFGAREVRKTAAGVRIKSRAGVKEQKRSRLGSGVTVQTKRSSAVARFPHGFIAKMASGHIGVFRRIAGSRKIHEIKVITIAAMFGQNIEKIARYASDYFARRFASKISGWKQL